MDKIFKADISNLREMLEFIISYAEKMGFKNSQLMEIEVACEEVIVNIVHYAYPARGGTVLISCENVENCLQIVLKDQGIAFDPLKNAPAVNLNAVAEDRPQGGLGIYFMMHMMDGVNYKRENDTNILTLVKKLNS